MPDSPLETPSGGALTKPSRRRACNECKQQKLRCNLTALENDDSNVCSRCQRLGLDCKIESNFRRTRKRRRSYDLENEVNELRRKLATYETNSSLTRISVNSNTASPPQSEHSPHGNLVFRELGATKSSMSFASRVGSRAPGLTTQPVIDLEQAPAALLVVPPQARRLDDLELSTVEIDELFATFFNHYHPFLPFLNTGKSPHAYYESSELLFWSIISAASHRSPNPTLLPRLARNVTELVWSTVRSIPYTLQSVQSLIILCTWPFPTSSSTADPTYTLAGIMLQLAFQMGLHCAPNAQDFTKVPLTLNTDEHSEWTATWQACNIVAYSVSVGCGLPATVQLQDWPLPSIAGLEKSTSAPEDPALRLHLRIEQYRHRVSVALSSNGFELQRPPANQGRVSLYRLLTTVYSDLEREVLAMSPLSTTRIYLSAALLHLHSFYLHDDPALSVYTERVATLYHTAYNFLSQCLEADNQGGLFHYWPFFCYQVFVAAALTVLKILMSDRFNSIIDVPAGKSLINSAILALRKMSIANNDLPARLSDVVGFLYSLPSHGPSGQPTHNLSLRVRNRSSMSIVYDSLWQWRRYFQMSQEDMSAHISDKFASLDHELPGSYSVVAQEAPPFEDQPIIDFDQFALADPFTFDWPDECLNLPLYN
ncbi:hypothetical protein ASPCAL01556 [Aspergillus calidoustus]|uniref:Zn(2)-C6 fungal-type domain-containing protein n=1 Tax=Aspergillus calidoustus TaxID=454130 RepID=A0A0U5C349_ASPCI|nr:hypothetical protein ASPCAL01556 [Aspergillus calidoustus]